MNIVLLSTGYFPDPALPRPIANGDIYIGIVGTDPEVESNQVQMQVLQEDGSVIDVDQPLNTSNGGVPTYNGSPVTVISTVTPYSLKVLSSQGAQKYYIPNVTESLGETYNFYPNPNATDHGVTGDSDTIKYYVDLIGTANATIVLLNSSGNDETIYTLTTSLTIPENINIESINGAKIGGTGTLTLYSPANIIAGNRQCIFGSSLTVAFSAAGTASPFWNYPGTGSWHTYINALDGFLFAGSTLLFPGGTYTSTAALTPNDDRTWKSESRFGAELVQDTSNDDVIYINGKDNVFIDGFYIEGTDDPTDTTNRGIYIYTDCNNVEVKNCYVTKTGRNGISVQQAETDAQPTNINILNNTITACQGNGVFYNGVKKGIITDNIIYGNGLGGTGYAGVGIILDCYWDNEAEDIIVSGNVVKDNAEGGIWVNGGNRINIDSNIVGGNGSSEFSSNIEDSNGIIVRAKTTNVPTTLFSNYCNITNNIVYNSYRHGIVTHGLNHGTISGNTVYDNGYDFAGTSVGIYNYLFGTTRHNNINITGNTIAQISATSNQKWGIRVEGLLHGSISDNILYQAGESGQIQIVGTSSYYVESVSIENNNIYDINTNTYAVLMSYYKNSVVDNNKIYDAGTNGFYFSTACEDITAGGGNKVFGATNDYTWVSDPMDNDWKYDEIITLLYDFSVDGGSTGNIVLGTQPDNFTITKAWYEVLTAPASGGAATIAVSTGEAADEIITATAYNNAVFNAGYHDAIPDGSAANFTTKTTAKRNINFTIAGADLTAGKIRFWLQRALSE